MSQNILIIGATSGIAEALARRYAVNGANLFLVGRSHEKLKIISGDLIARGALSVHIFVMDANDTNLIHYMADKAWSLLGSIDIALIAHGTLPDQIRAQQDISYAVAEFKTNAESFIACMLLLASRFESQRSGVIAIIGSVAGDRGRYRNYIYGAAKAAIETFSSGLRVRLFKKGVHLLLVKPGFVASSMTANLDLPVFLTVSTDKVALDILHAISKRKDVIYTPWYWNFVMLIIRWIPMPVFKRLKL